MRIGDIELTEPAVWDRKTIADGNWLQANTMKPLWENEIALARAIGENKEVVNLYLKNPGQEEEHPPEYWIADSEGNVVTKEQMVAWHAAGKYFILNESLDPEMNSRLYFLGRSVCTNQNIWMTFTSVEGGGVIDLIDVNVYADANGNIYSTGKNKTKSAEDRVIMCKVSYETSPYDVDEGRQLAYLKEVNDELYGDDLYITAEKCYKWMNEKSKILVLLGDSESQNYTYYLSSYWNQGKDAENRRKYRMTFVCNSAGDATKRRLVSTFLSENINSSYSTTKMRMYRVSDPQGIHWCNASYEVQDLVTEDQVVRVDYDQSSILTGAQKTRARNNIAASQIQYVQTVGQPSSRVGDLYIVDYESGKYLNDGTGNIAALAPIPADGDQDKGKVFTVDPNTGYLGWRPIPKVNPDVGKFIKLKQHKLQNYQSNSVYISNGYSGASISLDEVDGRYPSKIIGTMDVACNSNTNTEPSLSICVTKTAHQVGDNVFDPDDNSHNINYDILLGGNYYNNNLTFMFTSETCGIFKYTGIKYLSLKGRSDCTYNIKRLQLQCFYEKLPEPPPSNDSASVSENDSEND